MSELPMDEDFIQKLTAIVEDNLENEQFGVSELAGEIGISRSQLNRKLAKIVRKTPSKFIREYRLTKAMEMLQQNVATASEVAYRVGFGSPTYFSSCFKDFYGYPPGEVKYRNLLSESEQPHTGVTEGTAPQRKKTWAKRFVALTVMVAFVSVGVFYLQKLVSAGELTTDNGETEENIKSIAILPFKNLSLDQESEFFAEGVALSIHDNLNKIRNLRVISQTSMARYADNPLSAPEIGRELNVSHLLESSIQKNNGKVRLVTKLVDTQNDVQLWSETYDRELTDIFEIQSEMAKKIAVGLKFVLSPETVDRINRQPTESVEAYNLYQKGRYFDNFRIHKRSYKEGETSVHYFKKAIELDSNFSLAHSALAVAEIFAGNNLYAIDSVDYVKQLALKALELDPHNSEAHLALGLVASKYEWDWETAEKEFNRALELNPNNSEAFVNYSSFKYMVKGEFEEALELGKKALELDPLSLNALTNLGYLSINFNDHDNALNIAERLTEIKKDNIHAYFIAFSALLGQGNGEKAIKELEEIFGMLEADDVMKIYDVDEILNAFNEGGSQQLFRYFVEKNRQTYGGPHELDDFILYNDAQFLAIIGEYDMALEYLEIAYNRHCDMLFSTKYNPYFEPLRNHPRFLAILNGMNLKDYILVKGENPN